MKQLGFEFMKEVSREVEIGLSSEIEGKLIEDMAVMLIQVNIGGKSENDKSTTKQ